MEPVKDGGQQSRTRQRKKEKAERGEEAREPMGEGVHVESMLGSSRCGMSCMT
jgi:hypothetical protein